MVEYVQILYALEIGSNIQMLTLTKQVNFEQYFQGALWSVPSKSDYAFLAIIYPTNKPTRKVIRKSTSIFANKECNTNKLQQENVIS